MEENVTFSGKEASGHLTAAKLREICDTMFAEELPHHVFAGSLHGLRKLVEVCRSPQVHSIPNYFGLPIYRKSWVPIDEAWVMSADGKVMAKYKV